MRGRGYCPKSMWQWNGARRVRHGGREHAETVLPSPVSMLSGPSIATFGRRAPPTPRGGWRFACVRVLTANCQPPVANRRGPATEKLRVSAPKTQRPALPSRVPASASARALAVAPALRRHRPCATQRPWSSRGHSRQSPTPTTGQARCRRPAEANTIRMTVTLRIPFGMLFAGLCV